MMRAMSYWLAAWPLRRTAAVNSSTVMVPLRSLSISINISLRPEISSTGKLQAMTCAPHARAQNRVQCGSGCRDVSAAARHLWHAP